jgi:hypothetical protein
MNNMYFIARRVPRGEAISNPEERDRRSTRNGMEFSYRAKMEIIAYPQEIFR